jgi:hypothetical protein
VSRVAGEPVSAVPPVFDGGQDAKTIVAQTLEYRVIM